MIHIIYIQREREREKEREIARARERRSERRREKERAHWAEIESQQHMCSIHQHTSAYVSIRQHTFAESE